MNVTPTRDLRQVFGAVRSQGSRPTCCAFACSDLHAACRFPWTTLSCEYVFFCGARRQGTGPNNGVLLRHMLDALEVDGQPHEAAWPYDPVGPTDASFWSPPPDVGRLLRVRGVRSSGDVTKIEFSLDHGRPVLIIMTLSDAFYFGPGVNGIVDSNEAIDPTRVHALIGLGRGMRGSSGYTLVRNSWGETWGMSGHAWLADGYLAPRIIEVANFTELLDD